MVRVCRSGVLGARALLKGGSLSPPSSCAALSEFDDHAGEETLASVLGARRRARGRARLTCARARAVCAISTGGGLLQAWKLEVRACFVGQRV